MSDNKKLIIIGIGTNARHVYEFVRSYQLYDIVGFAVNEKYKDRELFLGLPVYSLEHLEEEYGNDDFVVFIALLWNKLNRDRRDLYEYCKKRGFHLTNIVSPHAILRSPLTGENCWIHDFVIVQNNASIGSNTAIMAFCLIGADTIIGDHCFFGAKSVLGGGSVVGEQSFIGINATVFDDTMVGKKCIVGACVALKRNLPDFSRCVVSSDSVIVKQYVEEEIESKLQFAKNKR